MLNLNEYFMDEYQFSLKSISYNVIETTTETNEYELQISDTINTEIINQHLHIEFARVLRFKPISIFNLTVTFNCNLQLKEDYIEKAKEVDWNNVLMKTPNPYLGNIASRASLLIANITSSFGQPPVITQPTPIV